MSGRIFEYKKGKTSATDFLGKLKENEISLRKLKKEKSVIAKRLKKDISSPPEETIPVVNYEEMKALLGCLESEKKLENRIVALRRLRKLLGSHSENRDLFVSFENSIQLLISKLTLSKIEEPHKSSPIQHEAAWCLSNLSSGSEIHSKACLPATSFLLTLLSSSDPIMQDLSAWTLANVCADSGEAREVLICQGAISAVFRRLRETKGEFSDVFRSGLFFLTNLAKGKSAHLDLFYEAGASDFLVFLFQTFPADLSILAEASWLLTHLTSVPSDGFTHLLFDTCLLTLLFQVFQEKFIHSDQDPETPFPSSTASTWFAFVTPMLRVFGNIVASSDYYSNQIMKNPEFRTILLSGLMKCFQLASISSSSSHSSSAQFAQQNNPFKHCKFEALWVLSNITAGPFDDASSVVEFGFLPLIVRLLFDSFQAQCEALYCLLNLAYASPEFIEDAVYEENDAGNYSLLKGLVSCLGTDSVQVLSLTLELLFCIVESFPDGNELVESFGGFELIENLIYHQNEGISNRASELLNFHEDFLQAQENNFEEGFS